MTLQDLGWNSFFEQHFQQLADKGVLPARVARESKGRYLVFAEGGEFSATVSGRFRHEASDYADFPSVGDWVAIKPRPGETQAIIHRLMPRRSTFSRRAVLAGKTEEQVLAANVDTVFLVNGMDGDFNLRRIERYVTIAWDSGATPVVVLNKSDLCDDIAAEVERVETTVFGVSVCAISAVDGLGLDLLDRYLTPGHTIAFLGSSGVGKSTIINRLLGQDRLRTGAVREFDNKGVHTTTYREMIILPSGAIVIDTPGMREIQIWSDEEGIDRSFGDIDDLALHCRFSDCQHHDQPGCAIQEAIASGDLDTKRFVNYMKLRKELHYLRVRQDQKAHRREVKAWQKKISKTLRERDKLKEKGLL